MSTIVHISKLDAAKRQLEMAIRLYMHNSDAVSIHTLTGAAHRILEDISLKRGKTSLIKEMLSSVRDEYRKEVELKFNKARNFFKHADVDPEGVVEFNSESSELELWDACRMYQTLTGELPPILGVYMAWFHIHHENLLILTPEQKQAYDHGRATVSNKDDRKEFLRVFLPIGELLYSGKS